MSWTARMLGWRSTLSQPSGHGGAYGRKTPTIRFTLVLAFIGIEASRRLSAARLDGAPYSGRCRTRRSEQLEGREADVRTDIFAFGAVLYEMPTGKKAFEGKSRASLIAAILQHDPAAILTFQPLLPTVLDRLVRKCLAIFGDRKPFLFAHTTYNETQGHSPETGSRS